MADQIITEYFKYINNLSNGLIPVLDFKEEQLGILDWSIHDLNEMPRLLSHILKLNAPIIRLTRRNRLAQYCSLMVATKTNKWSLSKDDSLNDGDLEISIDKKDLLRKLENYEKTEVLIDEWLCHSNQYTKLIYEDCFIDGKPSETLKQQIKNSLDIDINDQHIIKTQKIIKNFKQHILNMNEVESWLKGTPYETIS